MAESLTLLYTQGLGGDFALAARVGRWLRELRARYATDGVRALLLDLGGASDEDSWHHELTGGRAALFVLDAMGYHAVNAAGTLGGSLSAPLRAGYRTAILAPGSDWRDERGERWIRCTVAQQAEQCEGEALCVSLAPADETQLQSGVLRLAHVTAGCVGRAQLWLGDGGAQLLAAAVHSLPAHILPEPSIAATVDFVLSEARQLTARRNPPA